MQEVHGPSVSVMQPQNTVKDIQIKMMLEYRINFSHNNQDNPSTMTKSIAVVDLNKILRPNTNIFSDMNPKFTTKHPLNSLGDHEIVQEVMFTYLMVMTFTSRNHLKTLLSHPTSAKKAFCNGSVSSSIIILNRCKK